MSCVMTLMTRWEPLREFSAMHDRLNRMNRLFRESFSPVVPEEALTTTSYAPPVDIYEDEHNITLKLEAPGIDVKCLNCAGKGKLRCTSGCIDGHLICPECGGRRGCSNCSRTRMVSCSTCGGCGEIVCSQCQGSGSILANLTTSRGTAWIESR